ncbi:RNA polymerase sigma factor [Sphingobacterium paucimobilis]|uniref:HTH luxR-type domain-containing protein n=1 Tax=Sphingobacterium paucimobilis HER1398 TaxID=1346330 RepID=U2HVR3_9SPHI|nr:RNA polymerase sigma-70 factor [Sphingobacterium paucimobilis]ERJ59370.1 hypothetical protein M472_11355 [Sphingobacterium paucimobilis HER1398]
MAQKEKDFIEHLAKGANQAFQMLFEKYWSHVFSTVKKLVKSPELAEDIAQEIFVKVWHRREELSTISNIEAYLYTVSKNTTLDALRKKVLITENIDQLIHYFKDQALTPQQRLEYQELQQNIQQAIDTLPEKVKEVFVLSRFEGLSHEEISEKLNISITSSKTYIVRALKLIRAYMATNTDLPLLVMAALLLEEIISHTK